MPHMFLGGSILKTHCLGSCGCLTEPSGICSMDGSLGLLCYNVIFAWKSLAFLA